MITNTNKQPNKQSRKQCYLGLGSNLTNELGTPKQHIASAIHQLQNHQHITDVIVSSLYESEPYGVTDQPCFINAVVGLKTSLTPHELLAFCQSLEQNAKRKRIRHWGERSLDVDVLLYGDEQISTSDLTVPHAELCKRNFVLVPLAEIAPDLNIQNKPIAKMPLSHDLTGLHKLDATSQD